MLISALCCEIVSLRWFYLRLRHHLYPGGQVNKLHNKRHLFEENDP